VGGGACFTCVPRPCVVPFSCTHTHKETPKIPISSQISEGPSITTRRVSGEAGLWAESSTHGDYAPGLTRHFVLSMIYGVQLC